MKNKIVILIIILMTTTILGCTSNVESKKDEVYGSDYVNFQMPEGWEVHPMPGKGTVIWKNGDPRIRVIELKDKQKYETEYNSALNTDVKIYDVKKENKNINGMEVKVVKTIHNGNGDIEDQYFLEKNNKYYIVLGWDFPGWNSKKRASSREAIDKAVDTIVSTIY